MRSLRVLLFALLILPLFGASGTHLTVQVNSAESGRPIDRASVIVQFRHGLGPVKIKKMITRWETKTSQEGSVSIPEIPMGEIQIQVIAPNFQTFGEIYQLNMPQQTIAIKLNPPQPQYSEDAKPK